MTVPHKLKHHNLLLFSLLFALIFSFYRLPDRYTFNWDQSDDAAKVTSMLTTGKPLLLGPRVANDQGFFVPPLHYYFLTPFFVLTGGHPLSGAFAAISVYLLTVILAYFLFYQLLSPKTAFLISFLVALHPSLISWNVMYTLPLTLIFLYFGLKELASPGHYLYHLSFIFALTSATHLVPFSLIFPLLFIFILHRRHLSLLLFVSLGLFILLFWSPIIVFDFRHQFLNLHNIFNLLTHSQPGPDYFPTLFLRTLYRSLNYFYLPKWQVLLPPFIILVFAYFLKSLTHKRTAAFIMVWLAAPVLVLAFYKGNIPEYYYGCLTALIPVALAVFLSRFKTVILLPLLVALAALQVKYYLFNPVNLSLSHKLSVASFLVNQNRRRDFFVSYDLPFGFSDGFSYIFNYLGHSPTEGPESHFYTVTEQPGSHPVLFQSGSLAVIRK